jgi:hypothetical protein
MTFLVWKNIEYRARSDEGRRGEQKEGKIRLLTGNKLERISKPLLRDMRIARHAKTRSVSEGLQTKQFQRHPSLTRRVTKGFEMRSRLFRRQFLPRSGCIIHPCHTASVGKTSWLG